VKRNIESRLQKLELRRGKSPLEDMTDQQRNTRIGVLVEQLGGREKLLTELKARACKDLRLLPFISLLEQWEGQKAIRA
jgi:hypothetical protein